MRVQFYTAMTVAAMFAQTTPAFTVNQLVDEDHLGLLQIDQQQGQPDMNEVLARARSRANQADQVLKTVMNVESNEGGAAAKGKKMKTEASESESSSEESDSSSDDESDSDSSESDDDDGEDGDSEESS